MLVDRTIPLPENLLIGEQVTVLPEVLKAWRKERGWSQRQLALRSDCSEGLISTIESGHRQASLVVAMRIARALDIKIGALGLVHVDIDGLVPEAPEVAAG